MTEDDERRADLPIEISAAAAGATLGLVGGPPGALAGAAAGPLIARGLGALKDGVLARRVQRSGFVLARAAELAGTDVDVLLERMHQSDDREELLLRGLRAAEDAGHLERLVALAQSLARAAVDDEDASLHWEKAFVRVLGELDAPHVELLRRFT